MGAVVAGWVAGVRLGCVAASQVSRTLAGVVGWRVDTEAGGVAARSTLVQAADGVARKVVGVDPFVGMDRTEDLEVVRAVAVGDRSARVVDSRASLLADQVDPCVAAAATNHITDVVVTTRTVRPVDRYLWVPVQA